MTNSRCRSDSYKQSKENISSLLPRWEKYMRKPLRTSHGSRKKPLEIQKSRFGWMTTEWTMVKSHRTKRKTKTKPVSSEFFCSICLLVLLCVASDVSFFQFKRPAHLTASSFVSHGSWNVKKKGLINTIPASTCSLYCSDS